MPGGATGVSVTMVGARLGRIVRVFAPGLIDAVAKRAVAQGK